MQQGVDPGIVGSAYDAPDPYQDSQKSINYYVETSQDEKSKMPTALLSAPGLDSLIELAVGQVRGCWVLPGGEKAVVVSGSTAYLVQMIVPPTQTSLAQFTTSIIGTLLTNSGQVVIRDNGPGGYAVIVDGPYGYYYRIAGAGTTSFVGDFILGSTTISVASIPSDLIVGSEISNGTIGPGVTVTAININALEIEMSAGALGSASGVTTTVTLASFAQITDPYFMGADRVAFIDGWLIFNKPGTQTFYTTAPVPYTLIFDPLFFALKDSSSDNLITMETLNRELWLVGERSTEIWFDAGGAQFAFQRIPGAAPPIGCTSPQSISLCGDSLCWLGRTVEGQNVVVQTQQYTVQRISTHAIEAAIASYPQITDAIAYAYEDQGHLFYVLTFPTADKTWVYDFSTGKWHERASYDSATGEFHRHQSNCFMNLQNIRMVGDYQNGKLYNMARTIYDNDGELLVGLRRCPHIWSRENRQRIFHGSLQIEFAPGVGLQTGQGSNPQAMLRWSDDGGATFGNEHWTTVGAAGSYRNRAMWRRLGRARDRVYEVRITDPVYRDIVGATLYYAGSDA